MVQTQAVWLQSSCMPLNDLQWLAEHDREHILGKVFILREIGWLQITGHMVICAKSSKR